MAEQIKHSHLKIRDLSLHVAHIGEGEAGTVVFLHGFPEIWYSWRHQMIAVADAGFRAIAPDCRGYGLSDQPPESDDATSWENLTADLLAILDSLAVPKAFIVGKDFGAIAASHFVPKNPDRVLGVVTLGLPISPKGYSLGGLPEGFYVSRWQEPGRALADFGRLDVKTVVRNVYTLFAMSEIPIAEEGQEIMDLVDPSTPLPSWFNNDDLAAYAALYEKSGFTFAMQMPYMALSKELVAGDPKVEAPALLIMGCEDYVLKIPGMEDYIKSGMAKHFVPDLEVVFVPEGSHFVQEQFPGQVNQLLVSFLKSHI